MTIEKVNAKLPTSDKIIDINDQIIEVNGLAQQGKFDVNELTALYADSGLTRKFTRNNSLGASTGANAWYNWAHLTDESGYSIWKFDSNISYAVNTNNSMYMDDKVFSYKGTAQAESITAFDSVLLYDGSDFTDNTTEAASEGGTAFTLLTATTDYIYIGHNATFTGIRFKFGTKGANNTLKVEYSNSSGGYTQLTTNENTLSDGTSNHRRDGAITFASAPSDWDLATVNLLSKYWIRISTTTTPVTDATASAVLPYNSVPTLLALSSQDVKDEKWAFCDYDIGGGSGSRLYATFKNTGDPSYEGNNHVTSSSTNPVKQNFFRFNHTLKADFQDVDYLALDHMESVTSDKTLTNANKIVVVNANTESINITLPTAVGREGKEYYLKVVNITSGANILTTGSETIDGSGAQAFSAVNESFKVVSDNTNWLIIEKYSGE